MSRRAQRKAQALYDAIDDSDGFYATPCHQTHARSRMNVPFNVNGGDAAATDAFLRAAYHHNMVGFRTLTPFGYGEWLRASLYTAITVGQADALAAFMTTFAASWPPSAPPTTPTLAPLDTPLAHPALATHLTPQPFALRPANKATTLTTLAAIPPMGCDALPPRTKSSAAKAARLDGATAPH